MIGRTLGHVFRRRARSAAADDAEQRLKILAQSKDPGERLAAAADPKAPPELLYYLARDISPEVRQAVAGNPGTPRQADLILALDNVPETRQRVAQKISGALAQRTTESAQIWALTLHVLEALARDDIPKVRSLIAEGAKDIEQVPPALMTELGRDRVADVAVPALGYKGPMQDRDLVEIVTGAPDQRVIGAVARRPAIGTNVSDAVIAHGDVPSIALLLENRTAAISPESLDRVVDRAPPVPSWHEPLVRRPALTDSAAMRLASFVADKLVKVLQGRPDLDPETNAAISAVVKQRAEPPEPIDAEIVDTEGPVNRARRLHAEGTLGEDLLIDAVGHDPAFLVTALALRTKLPTAVVQKMLSSNSAKGLCALVWKAGYTMRLATQLQLRLARLPSKARLNATGGNGFPLTPDEMQWQVEFFKTLVPRGV